MKKKSKNKSDFFSEKKKIGVKKSKFANRLKRALPKFRDDRSEVRRVDGRFRNLDPVLGALINLSTDTK